MPGLVGISRKTFKAHIWKISQIMLDLYNPLISLSMIKETILSIRQDCIGCRIFTKTGTIDCGNKTPHRNTSGEGCFIHVGKRLLISKDSLHHCWTIMVSNDSNSIIARGARRSCWSDSGSKEKLLIFSSSVLSKRKCDHVLHGFHFSWNQYAKQNVVCSCLPNLQFNPGRFKNLWWMAMNIQKTLNTLKNRYSFCQTGKGKRNNYCWRSGYSCFVHEYGPKTVQSRKDIR